MYRKIVGTVLALALIGGGAWFFMRSSRTDTAPVVPVVITDATIINLLPGTVLHVPVTDTSTVDVTLDAYILAGERVLGGATPPLVSGESAHVIVPDFTQSLPHGTWVYTQTTETPGSMRVGSTRLGTPVYAPTASSTYQYVLLPLYVNFGGTGTFLMIALFYYDEKAGVLAHRGLHFIDDRVVFEGFEAGADNDVVLHYLTRAEGEAMADAPTHPMMRTLRIANGAVTIVE